MNRILLLVAAFMAGILASVAATWNDARTPVPAASSSMTSVQTLSAPTPHPSRAPLLSAGFEVADAGNALTSLLPGRQGAGKAVSITDLSGEYVHTYKTLSSSFGDGGCAVTVTPVAGTDSIAITNFWSPGITVKAKVDLAAGTITIPNQRVMVHATYGPMDIAVITSQALPNRTAPITGTINSDGTITITSWWGVFIEEGENKDAYVAASHSTLLERPNAVMTQKHVSGTTTLYGVVLQQPYDNQVFVKNFANYGRTVTISLTGGTDGYIPQQTARQDGAGVWKTIAVLGYADGNLNYANIINVTGLEKRKLSWGPWSLLATSTGTTYFLGHMTEGYIVPDFDLVIPGVASTALEGEGTESNPWKIKSLADLNYLAQQVNYSTDYNGLLVTDSYSIKYARVFIGKYFRLENDIDMAGWNFTPIGCDYSHRFAGTFDGNGHKLTNLQVDASAQMAAGLIGYADTVSTIRNLYIDKADIRGCDYYAAPVAGLSLGLIENCHVTDAKVFNSNIGAAGLVGYAKDVKNSTVKGAVTTAMYGFTAGFATQVMGEMSNCSATGITAVGSSSTSADGRYDMSGTCMGGLVASLFGTVRDSYFAGTVDAQSYGVAQYAGGIAGTVTTGKIERCFSVGTIMGTGAGCVTGGVAGWCSGTVTDCYSSGLVAATASKYVGGITGRLSAYQATGGAKLEANVNNSFTHAVVMTDLYQYDTSEMRETAGKVWPGASPTVTNLYFDNQVINFRSQLFGATTATLTSGTPLTGLDTSVWSYAAGRYPMLKSLENTEMAKMASSAILMTGSTTLANFNVDTRLTPLGASKFSFLNGGKLSDNGHFASIVGDSIILNKQFEFGTDTLFLTNGSEAIYYVVKIAPKFLDGEGTAENPFLIKNKEDLITLSEATTVTKQYFPGTYFLMTADIDLEYDKAFLGVCGDGSVSTMKFAGVFDGGGHTIHRMDRDIVVWTVAPENATNGIGTAQSNVGTYSGFCSRLDATGVIRNLTIAADCRIGGFSRTGAFAGESYGTIENCVNHADVYAVSMGAGGITSYLYKGGKIVNCLNTGSVRTGYQSVGGMAGYMYGTAENCVNTGDVSATVLSTLQGPASTSLKYVGGIGGNCLGAVMKNCVNYGTIYAYSGAAGGLAGRFPASSAGDGSNDAVNCFNFGMVYTPDMTTIGAIAGEKGTTGMTANTYWDAQLLPLKGAANDVLKGAEGATTAQLTSGTPLQSFSDSIWDFKSGMYPTVKIFAGDAKVNAARRMMFSIPDDYTAWSIRGSITLPAGITWSLTDGTAFKIAGNVLTAPEASKTAILDTLVASLDGIRKPILLKAIPGIPLDGKGSAADPYLITSTDDWNNLSDYISQSGDHLGGKYVAVTTDLDFTGKSMKRMGADGVTPFGAIIDFRGHKLTFTDAAAVAYSGAFGTVATGGGVKNLVLNATITSANTYAAALAGYGNGDFENITFTGKLSCSKAYSGGLVALAGDGATFTRCVNAGTVKGLTTVGGIVCKAGTGCVFTACGNEGTVGSTQTTTSVAYIGGVVAESAPSTYIDCYNKGTFDIPVTLTGVGGVLANGSGKANSQAFVMRRCHNDAPITVGSACGGVVYTFSTTAGNSKLEMDSCWNTAAITAVGTTNAGPLAGVVAKYPAGANIRDCWNTGVITSTKTQNCGGVLGTISVAPTAAYPTTITRCYNTADITITDAQSAGGFIGLISNYTTVDDCWNSGNVRATGIAGGFAATFSGNYSTVKNCWNSGNVNATAYRVGGLYGANTGTTSNVTEYCFNIGSVATASTTQGTAAASGSQIGGLAGAGYGAFSHCWNSGEVTGVSQVGGLVGQPSKGKTCLTSCINAGRIYAPADTAGNLVGVNTANGKIWTADNKVTDCYYASDLDTLANNAIGTPLPLSELCKAGMGEMWNGNDDYTLPVQKVHAGKDAAVVGAAQMVLQGSDNRNSVTRGIYVGSSDKVEWTLTPAKYELGNNKIHFTSQYIGDAVLTAKAGSFTKSYKLKLNIGTGVESVDGAEIVKEMWFTTEGVQLRTRPESGIVIAVRFYSDGRREAVREVIK